MKQCPFCMGEIPAAALKCQHCGEWVNGRAAGGDSELGRAASRYVNWKIATSVVALILTLLVFFLFWLPNWNRMHRNFDNFPTFPSSPK